MRKLAYAISSKIAIFCAVLLLTTCAKKTDPEPPVQQDQLPPRTQNGAYTFGCLVNDEVWLPKSYSISVVNPPVVLFTDYYDGLFKVIATHDRKDDNSPKQVMGFYLFDEDPKDTIYLDTVDTESYFYMGISPPKAEVNGVYSHYMSLSNSNSWVHFTRFDITNRIASGNFSVDLLNVDDIHDTLLIRDGRFDVPF